MKNDIQPLIEKMEKEWTEKFPRLMFTINKDPIGYRDFREEADGSYMKQYFFYSMQEAYDKGVADGYADRAKIHQDSYEAGKSDALKGLRDSLLALIDDRLKQ